MNNLQFIATYINENPGKTRYNEIIKNLMLWTGHPAHAIANIGGQYSTYFTKGWMQISMSSERMIRLGGYKNILWEKIDKNNRQSGYKLTTKGLAYVVKGE